MVSTVDEILTEWAKDSNVDESRVPEELLKIPKLHSKYVRYRAEHSLLAKKKMVDYEKMKAVKWDYYSGIMPKEELDDRGWKPYLYTAKNKDTLERCITKDDDLNNILLMKVVNDEAVELCTSIIRELNARTYQLRAWVDYQRFMLGH